MCAISATPFDAFFPKCILHLPSDRESGWPAYSTVHAHCSSDLLDKILIQSQKDAIERCVCATEPSRTILANVAAVDCDLMGNAIKMWFLPCTEVGLFPDVDFRTTKFGRYVQQNPTHRALPNRS